MEPLEAIVAKQEITEAIYRYCRGLDRMDRRLALSFWLPGGTADYDPWYQGTGEGFVDWVFEAHAAVVIHAHQIHNVLIELAGGDQAASESYFTAVLRLEPTPGRLVDRIVRGRYLDRWARRDGVWGAEHRQAVQDIESVSDVRDTGKSDGRARRGPEDPSYDLFSGSPSLRTDQRS
jgi:hypothetical protein